MKEGITLETIRRSGVFNNMDLELGRYVSGGKPETCPVLFLAGALASWAVQQGHSCCDLNQLAGQIINDDDEGEKQLLLPTLEDFRSALLQAPKMAAVLPDQPIGKKPLILDPAGRLYLNRYYLYEKNVAGQLAKRRNINRLGGQGWNDLPEIQRGKIAGISDLFKTAAFADEPDWQQAAVFLAHARNFSIITGGPGTGKTTVMTALLAWELEDDPEIRISLCAPTGKAVNRMKTSIAEELPKIHCSDRVRELLAALTDCCTTVDSLLHPVLHTTNYKMGRNQSVEADLVILDEVSMSSLSQLSHLFDALQDETRLILIGDKDQLTSVEAGSVLGDLIGRASLNVMPPELSARFEQASGWKIPSVSDDRPLSGAVIELQKNYRAKNAPEICAVSAGIKHLPDGGDPTALCRDIVKRESDEFHFYRCLKNEKALKKELTGFLDPAREMIRLASTGEKEDLIKALFDQMESFRILCAVRSGLTGVENVNRMAASILNLRSDHSVGMPLIVLENTPLLGLSNGDVGLVWIPKNSNQTVVAFPDVNRSFKIVRFAEMPPFEQVFAMTVHKSQGSGFDHVMILLPPKDVPILTRELIYTAVTRAKKSVRLYASEEILEETLKNATVWYSGMSDQLKDHITDEP